MADDTAQTKHIHPLNWLGWLLAVVFLAVAAGLAHKVATVRGELNTSQGGSAQMQVQLDHANQIVAVLSSPQAAHVVLTETRQAIHPVGQVSWPIPAGLFRPDADHGATVVLPPLPAETQAKSFLVTVEPGHGSETPSLPIVIEGQ